MVSGRGVITYPKSLSDIRKTSGKLVRISEGTFRISTHSVRNTKCFRFLKSIFRISHFGYPKSLSDIRKISGKLVRISEGTFRISKHEHAVQYCTLEILNASDFSSPCFGYHIISDTRKAFQISARHLENWFGFQKELFGYQNMLFNIVR